VSDPSLAPSAGGLGSRLSSWSLAAWASLLAAFATLTFQVTRNVWINGDTTALLKSLPSASVCLGHHVYRGCNGRTIGSTHTYVEKFPPIQLVPAYVLHLFGLSMWGERVGLELLNLSAVTGFIVLALAWTYRRAGTPLTVVVGLFLIPGLLVPYVAQTFAEPLAFVAFGVVTLAALRRDAVSPWLLVSAALATCSKETAAPFVLGFALAALGLSGANRAVLRRAIIHLGAGVLLGLAILAGLNEFRYGTLLNHVYLGEARAPRDMIANNFLAQFVSPNAGIAWFWPGFALAIIIVVVAVFGSTGWPGVGRNRSRLSAGLALATFVVSVGSLAEWWDPFGWYAWGPRLLIPAGGAMIVLAVQLLAAHRLRRSWLSPLGATLLAVMAALVLLPSEGVVIHPASYDVQVVSLYRELPICAPNKAKPLSAVQTRACQLLETWPTNAMPLRDAVSNSVGQGVWWPLFGFSVLTVLLWLRQARHRVEPDPDSDDDPPSDSGRHQVSEVVLGKA
jgi:hypothetical protein